MRRESSDDDRSIAGSSCISSTTATTTALTESERSSVRARVATSSGDGGTVVGLWCSFEVRVRLMRGNGSVEVRVAPDTWERWWCERCTCERECVRACASGDEQR